MALWSRDFLLLVVVAVLATLAPADGSIFDRVRRQSPEGNKTAGGSLATEMSVGCVCDDRPTLACHCGVGIDADIMGNRVVFEPKVNVEFIPKNVSLAMSVTNQGQTLYSNVIAGEKMIPPVCITVPQFPFVGLCISFNNLSADLERKSVSFCTVLELNTMPVGLPKPPTMPVGCFSAGVKDGLKYTAPEIKLPGSSLPSGTEDADKLISGIIPKVPTPFDNLFIGWPFGRSAVEQADKPEITADVGAGANLDA